MTEKCRHCGVLIIYRPMEGFDWWHSLPGDDSVYPYLNCRSTTIAEPEPNRWVEDTEAGAIG